MSSPISMTPRSLSASLLYSPTYLSAHVLNYALSIVQGKASLSKNIQLDGNNEYRSLQETGTDNKSTPAVVEYESSVLAVQHQSPTTNGGIQRKYAQHGHHIMALSVKEMDEPTIQTEWQSSTTPSHADLENDISRQLYVHALTYLLRALPERLSGSEAMDLGRYIPDSVIAEEYRRRAELRGESLPSGAASDESAAGFENNTKMEETVVAMIRLLASTLRVSTPYVIEILRKMAEKEREYRLSERTIALSYAVANRMSQSPLGNAMLSTGMSLLGAIGKGLGEGLVILTEPQQRFQSVKANL
ncbi:hypothetical protein V1512DRAFT_218613 [Lipomyces arxii]|uniref:uncharacterized protein n=1 Tax=Lipomyces arxii TaxID=56418 RepID=UPI0034CE8C4A